MTRVGYGIRHPALAALLDALQPAATGEAVWADGTMPLRIAAYTRPADLPDEIVTTVRCVVHVGDELVLCTNAHGISHVWPGGRREPGETYVETAVREVHEETGWHLDPATARPIGWLHLEHQRPVPDDYAYPHPDFLQLVYRAAATSRDPDHVTDVEGWEVSSRLVGVAEARTLIAGDPMNALFLGFADAPPPTGRSRPPSSR